MRLMTTAEKSTKGMALSDLEENQEVVLGAEEVSCSFLSRMVKELFYCSVLCLLQGNA